MEETIQKEEGVSLMDILRLLLSKIKILILVMIIGGMAGGIFAIFRTYGVDYYGTVDPIEFYVNPENPKEIEGESSQYSVYGAYGRHVMDNMVKLLSSESFAEKLMLNGEALPNPKGWTDDEETAALLTEKVAEAQTKIDAATKAEETVNTANTDVKDALAALEKAWDLVVCDLPEYKDISYSDAAFEKHFESLKTKVGASNSYIMALEGAHEHYVLASEAAKSAKAVAKTAKDDAETYTEEALEVWRSTDKYASELYKYSSTVTYTYLEEDADIEDANNLARSFIYVEISVLNDKEFANELYERIKTVVPQYVEENMTIPAGYTGTNCQRVTRMDAPELTNKYYTITQAIKYALIFAAISLVVACIAVIIIDKSDKKLRDYEVISKKFNVPVLGVIPTIDELVDESNAKKKGEKSNKNDTEVQ